MSPYSLILFDESVLGAPMKSMRLTKHVKNVTLGLCVLFKRHPLKAWNQQEASGTIWPLGRDGGRWAWGGGRNAKSPMTTA